MHLKSLHTPLFIAWLIASTLKILTFLKSFLSSKFKVCGWICNSHFWLTRSFLVYYQNHDHLVSGLLSIWFTLRLSWAYSKSSIFVLNKSKEIDTSFTLESTCPCFKSVLLKPRDDYPKEFVLGSHSYATQEVDYPLRSPKPFFKGLLLWSRS